MELDQQSIKSLRIRQALGRLCLRKLRQWEREGEAKASQAIPIYEAQLREITQTLKRKLRLRREAAGIEKPPPVVVQMKTARLGAAGQKVKGTIDG